MYIERRVRFLIVVLIMIALDCNVIAQDDDESVIHPLPKVTKEIPGSTEEAKTKDYVQSEFSDCAGKYIYFKNNCNFSIQLAVKIRESCGGSVEWNSHGWFNFDPHEGYNNLYMSGKNLVTDHPVIYFYAKSTEDDYIWCGNYSNDFDERTLQMIELNLKPNEDGDYIFSIDCFDEQITYSNGQSTELVNSDQC